MRLDRNYNVVIETDEEKEALAEAVRRRIRYLEETEAEADAESAFDEVETIGREIDILSDIWATLDRAQQEGRRSWQK